MEGKQIQIETEVYDKLETRAQQLGLTVEQYVQMLFESLDQASVTVSTIVVEVELTQGLYNKVKQFVETSDQAYDSISEFIQEATREHLLKKRTLLYL